MRAPALQNIFVFVVHYKMVRRERSISGLRAGALPRLASETRLRVQRPFRSLAIYAIMKFAARPTRDVEDAVPYCGAGHITSSRFSNIPKFRRGPVPPPYRLFFLHLTFPIATYPIFSERRTAPRSTTIILYYLFFIHSNRLLQLLTPPS